MEQQREINNTKAANRLYNCPCGILLCFSIPLTASLFDLMTFIRIDLLKKNLIGTNVYGTWVSKKQLK